MNTIKKSLGFIGLGMMGYPMAGHLYRAGQDLTVFDTARAQIDEFTSEYTGSTAANALNAFSNVEAVITMLPDSDAVDATVLGQADHPGLIDILPMGGVVIDMSSSQPMRSRALAQTLEKRGLHFLDAPVSGGVKGAVNGSLTIMAGGDEGQFHRYYDVFECMGQAITLVGGPGAGHALKALNNYVSAAGIIAAAEALKVGQEFGLDPAVMTDIFNSSTGQNYATTNKVKQHMLSGTFNSGFALQLMIKDVGTALNLSDLLDRNMRLGNEVLKIWSEAGGVLGKSADHTEIYRYLQAIEKEH
jgi:3-hydroxyisobutyrate dehydrogenase